MMQRTQIRRQIRLYRIPKHCGGTHRSYTIQPGDTITKISIRNYGNTKKIGEICELNSLSETDLIYPGQKILLP
ncbi:MAG: LysM peptidoglycan-binding domain-containing protein [Blautia hansenii]